MFSSSCEENNARAAALHEPLLHDHMSATVIDCDDLKSNKTTACCSLEQLARPILCALMMAEFGFLFYKNDPSTQELSCMTVYMLIALFALASFAYRLSLDDVFSSTSGSTLLAEPVASIMSLLPEATADVVLATMVFGFAQEAVFELLTVTFFMASFVAVNSIYFLLFPQQLRRIPKWKDNRDITILDGLQGYSSYV